MYPPNLKFILFFYTDIIKLFSCGKAYYRTFHLDAENDVLYVGAM